jgi:hypothetical protein
MPVTASVCSVSSAILLLIDRQITVSSKLLLGKVVADCEASFSDFAIDHWLGFGTLLPAIEFDRSSAVEAGGDGGRCAGADKLWP